MNPVLATEPNPVPAWACLLGLLQAVALAAGFTLALVLA
jgi:hypothetical protein